MFHKGHTCLWNDARNNARYASSLRLVPPQALWIVESSDVSVQSIKMTVCKPFHCHQHTDLVQRVLLLCVIKIYIHLNTSS